MGTNWNYIYITFNDKFQDPYYVKIPVDLSWCDGISLVWLLEQQRV